MVSQLSATREGHKTDKVWRNLPVNALMTIQVRVLSAQALAQLRAVEAQSKRTAATGIGGMSRAAQYGIPWLSKWGNQVQWAGRQLQYNFTMPIAIAMGMATKFALENEAAAVRIKKVYGDLSMSSEQVTNETNALRGAFEALSNQYGVAQKDVLAIAGDWAAAGASGIALARATKLTLETMILGEIGAEEATRNLIAIQAQYGQNTKELTKTIEILNMVENQTGTTMKDLMDGLARAAGVARTAGVDVRHLSAMIAALTPSAGSAATAGNGLRTIISRILQPTTAAADVMRVLGLNMDDQTVSSLNATQRLELMADAYDKLSGSGKIYAASIIASRWQVNRFTVLMKALTNQNSYYNKALRSTRNETDLYAQKQKELNQVLESNPQRMKQAWVILQNAMSDVIVPLLPLFVYLASEVARAANAFASMDGEVQKLVLGGLLFLAVIGPIARYVGSVANLFGLLSAATHWFAIQMGLAATTTELADGSIRRSRRGIVGLLRLLTIAPIMGFVNALGAVGGGFLGLAKKMFNYAKTTLTITEATTVAEIKSNSARLASATATAQGAVAVEQAAAGQRAAVAAMSGASRVTEETVAQAAQTAAVTVAALERGSIEQAEQFRRTFFVDGGGVARTAAEAAEQTERLFIVNSAGVTRAAYEQAEQMRRIFVVETGGAVRIGLEAAVQDQLTALTMAGIAARTWAEQTGATASIAPILAIESGKHAQILALEAGSSAKQLAIRAATASEVVAISTAEATAVVTTQSKAAAAVVTFWARVRWLLVGVWVAVAIAIGSIIYALRDDIQRGFQAAVDYIRDVAPGILEPFAPVGRFFESMVNYIIDAFWRLPAGVRNALLTVLNMIKSVALQVYDWFSYLNPWARHSPSLVESVKSGMDAVMREYGRARTVGSVFGQAAKDLAAFKRVSASMGKGEWSDERKDVKAQMPSALPIFNSLVNDLNRLTPLMNRQEAAVKAQQAVVDNWSKKLDTANDGLDAQQAILDKLKARLQAVQDQYDMHSEALQNFANAPIEGMTAMNDAIFENEIAQKRLQLQMAKWQQANGSVDDLRNRLGLLRGDIETLTGQASDLRMAGAGSDILGPINDQIAAMEAQAKATRDAVNNSPIDAMQKQLDDLQKQGEILNLEFDVKYDPLTRKIQQLADAQKELSYDDIVAGIRNEQAAMAALQPTIDRLNGAIATQQSVVDQATKARDQLQSRYDAEQKQLDALNDKYQKTADLVREIESALRDMGSAASASAQAAASKAAKNAKDAGALIPGGSFPEVGGKNAIGREGGMGDQSKLIDQFTQDTIDQMNSIFGGFDMFAPVKRWWRKTWSWIEDNIGPMVGPIAHGIGDAVSGALDALDSANMGQKARNFARPFSAMFDTIADIFRTLAGWISKAWKLIRPDVKKIGDALVEFGQNLWKKVGPEVVKFKKLVEPLGKAFRNIWRLAKPLLGGALLAIAYSLKQAFSILGHIVDPVLDTIIDVVRGSLRFMRGFFEILLGLITLNKGLIWDGMKDMFGGAFTAVYGIIKGAVRLIIGLVRGLVEGIVGFFKWLYDVIVGHSIVPDMVDGIIWWFEKLATIPKWLWDNVLLLIYHAFKMIWSDYVKPALRAWWTGWKAVWRVLFAIAGWLWDNVLKPVFNKVRDLWNDFVRPALAAWWGGIKTVWRVLFAVAGWLWDNVLKPVFDKTKSLWSDHVRPELSKWFERIKNVWDNLTRLGGWIKDNVMDPIFNAFKTGWNAIKNWFQDNGSMILNPIKSVVRGIVDAINWVIKGLNKLDDLPGVSIDISTISLPREFASGGSMPSRRVGNGFITSGARAIVGEGKPNYPEYVIPTDPTYRHRAQSLVQAAADRLGMQAVPMHFGGGILGDLGDALGGVVDLGKAAWGNVKDAGKMAIGTTMAPFFALADKAAGQIDWSIGRQAARGGIGVVRGWVDGLKQEYKDQYAQQAAANAPAAYSNFDTKAGDWQRVSFRGVTMDAGQVRAVLAAEKQIGQQFHITQGSYSTSVSASGTTHAGGGAFDATSPVTTTALNALRAHGQAAWIRTPAQGPWPYHIHSIMIGDPNLSPAAASQVQSFLSGGIGLQYGGIVKKAMGGTQITAGEGGRDEAVIPLPRNWRTDAWSPSGGGDTFTININGNLEFPNIKNGDDAQTLVDNLIILAKD